MPHGPFRRVVGPDPANGIRGDVLRPALINDIYAALEETPTLDDVQSPVNLQGVLTSTGDLPDDGNTTGDAYLVNGIVWVWDGSAWSNQGSLTVGEQGDPGLLNLKGTVALESDLPASGNVVNDVWIVEDDGHGWAWTTDHEWVDIGPFQGPAGPAGDLDATVGVGDYRTTVSWDENGDPAKAGIPVSPLLFGAVGDGVADDTDALLAMITALDLTGTSSLASGRGIILDGHNRTYKVTAPIVFSDVRWLRLRNFHFLVGANVADVLLFKGVSYSEVSNILIDADGGWSGFTADYCVRVESNQGVTVPAGVATTNKFTDIQVIDIKHKTAFAFGVNSAGNQVSENVLFACQAKGNTSVDSPDATWYQHGFQFGSSTSGNILNNDAYGCRASSYTYAVDINATNLNWFGGGADQSVQSFRHQGSFNFYTVGLRSEGCRRFLTTSAGTEFAPGITIQSLNFTCNELHADEVWLLNSARGHVALHDAHISAVTPGVAPKVSMADNEGGFLEVHGMRNYAPLEDCFTFSAAAGGVIWGFIERDPDDDSVVEETFGPTYLGAAEVTPESPTHIAEYLAADQSTTLATAVDITGLSFPIAANEVWTWMLNAGTNCNNSGGVKFTVSSPAGSDTQAKGHGANTSTGSILMVDFFSQGSFTSAINKYIGNGWCQIWGTVVNGATPGTVQMQFAAQTAGQTAKLDGVMTYMVADRIS